MKNIAIMTLLTLAAFSQAHAATAYEAAREKAVAQAQNEIQLMDNATPEELQSFFGLSNNQSEEERMSMPVEINVSVARQELTISYPNGQFSLPVSTARAGYHTKTGCFSKLRLEKMHYSKKYENSPMPHSMFYSGGFAVHGTMEEYELGRPASHGCVRVSRKDAARLYEIVQAAGPGNTQICIH